MNFKAVMVLVAMLALAALVVARPLSSNPIQARCPMMDLSPVVVSNSTGGGFSTTYEYIEDSEDEDDGGVKPNHLLKRAKKAYKKRCQGLCMYIINKKKKKLEAEGTASLPDPPEKRDVTVNWLHETKSQIKKRCIPGRNDDCHGHEMDDWQWDSWEKADWKAAGLEQYGPGSPY